MTNDNKADDVLSRLEAEAFKQDSLEVPEEEPEVSIWSIPKRARNRFVALFLLFISTIHFTFYLCYPKTYVISPSFINLFTQIGYVSTMMAFILVVIEEAIRSAYRKYNRWQITRRQEQERKVIRSFLSRIEKQKGENRP